MTWVEYLFFAWFFPAAVGAMFSLVVIIVGVQERSAADKKRGAWLFLLSPVWPVVLVALIPLVIKTADFKDWRDSSE